MSPFEGMYEHAEMSEVCFVGFHSEHARYDFGIIYTKRFFGNPLVIDMQSGKFHLINAFDASNKEWIKATFRTTRDDEADALIQFFKSYFPAHAYSTEF